MEISWGTVLSDAGHTALRNNPKQEMTMTINAVARDSLLAMLDEIADLGGTQLCAQ